jgi:hypothetical protein
MCVDRTLSEQADASQPPDLHPLDAVIWQALTSVQKNLAQGAGRARRYPAAIAPFAATLDTGPASFRSLLDLVSGDEQIASFLGRLTAAQTRQLGDLRPKYRQA